MPSTKKRNFILLIKIQNYPIMLRTFSFILISFSFIDCQFTPKEETIKNNDNSRLKSFSYDNSSFIRKKNYRVYLPSSYNKNPQKSYPVLYMMDNQNLFFGSESYGRTAWNIDNISDSLAKLKAIPEIIIVGIDHASEDRFFEYIPQTPMMNLPEKVKKDFQSIEKIYSDKFLHFLIQELKPTIDSSFRTSSDMENTFIGGSSMGGLISMYATCEYPEVFGGAMCLSTHWIIGMDDSEPAYGNAMVDYFKENIPPNKRWYFDHGTVGLDQYYAPFQEKIDTILSEKYSNSNDWRSKVFEGHNHNERFWNKRLAIPMTFLLKK
jgi:enterochelin esterase-like enzyme